VEEQRNVSSLKGEDGPSRGRQQTELHLSALLDRLMQTSRYAVVEEGNSWHQKAMKWNWTARKRKIS